MLKVIFQILIIYLIYKLIFDLIIPAFRKISQDRTQVKDFKNQNDNKDSGNQHAGPKEKSRIGEYIDFEDIKEK